MKKVLLTLLFVLFIGSGAIYFWLHKITNKIFIPHANSASASASSLQHDFDTDTSFSVLLLGYPGGSDENEGDAYLTDSMMVVHVDPKQKKIALISIPRDTWIKIPTNGTDGSDWKINAAYTLGMDDKDYPNKQAQFKGTDGAGHLAEYVVSQVTGLPINNFVGVDYTAFENTINTLGDVDITVEKTFDDYEYPITGKETDTCGHTDAEIASLSAQLASPSATITEVDAFPCRYEHLHFDKGATHMDGATALKYARSRHSLQDGTDFGRAKRQRNLFVGVKQKIFSVGFIPKVFPFITSLQDDIRTDLTTNDVKAFIENANVLNKYTIQDFALTDQNVLIDTVSSDGQDILESKDGPDNWASVHNWISDQLSGKTEPVSAIGNDYNAKEGKKIPSGK